MSGSHHYDAPFHWWGPGPVPGESLTLSSLVHNGTIDLDLAAILWASVRARRSLTVIGGPSGLGKSTLVHALLPALPQGTQRVYLRGCYETFAFRDETACDPASTALLVNEISPHLPIYLWGPAVQRTLAAGNAGYQILATAHGRDVVDFAASLTGSPLRIPARLLSIINLLALLEPVPEGVGRRLAGIWQLASGARDGVTLDQVSLGHLPVNVTAHDVANARATLFP